MPPKKANKFKPVGLQLAPIPKEEKEEKNVESVPTQIQQNSQSKVESAEGEFKISQSGSWEIDNVQKIGKDGIKSNSSSTASSPMPTAGKTPESSSSTTSEAIFDAEAGETKIQFEDLVVLGKLGSGASASVKKVEHKKTKETFAQKIVAIDQKEKSKVIIAEIKALHNNSTCPNVIKMYDAYYREGNIYIILEYMNCGSIADILQTVGPFSESVISKIASQVLKGLVYLHVNKKIVHRDIKPANILVNHKGVVKLADFGMAGYKKPTELQQSKVEFETFQGTYIYMSPERIQGAKHSFDSDLWSVGLTLAECAVGKFPLEMQEMNIWELVMQEQSISDLLQHPPGASSEYKNFIEQMLKTNPKERPTAQSLLDHPFIKMYESVEPTIEKWLKTGYIAKKKEEKKLKEAAKKKK